MQKCQSGPKAVSGYLESSVGAELLRTVIISPSPLHPLAKSVPRVAALIAPPLPLLPPVMLLPSNAGTISLLTELF